MVYCMIISIARSPKLKSKAHIAILRRPSADSSCEEANIGPSTIAIVDVGAALPVTSEHVVASWDPPYTRDVCRCCACGNRIYSFRCIQRGVVAICRGSRGIAYGRKSGVFTWTAVTPACRRVPWRTVGPAVRQWCGSRG